VTGPPKKEIAALEIDCISQVGCPGLAQGDVCPIYTVATRPEEG
jgi:hypothetical protein